MGKELNFETVDEARESNRKQYPDLISVVDVEHEIRKSEIWDVLLDLENHTISRPRAEIILREHYCDVVQGTPIVEEKYGDADKLQFYKDAFEECCRALAAFDTCPGNEFCPHLDTEVKCKDCWRGYIENIVTERRKNGVHR